jgi:hypothetical protein
MTKCFLYSYITSAAKPHTGLKQPNVTNMAGSLKALGTMMLEEGLWDVLFHCWYKHDEKDALQTLS